MEAFRFGVKMFVDGAAPPAGAFVPVFHSWIQKQCIEGHLLVDVHDYSHIHHGPGILLVAHEGNFSMDSAEGRLGLVYYRKQPLSGPLADRLGAALKSALLGCRLLQEEPGLAPPVRFRADEVVFFANDRLLAPNEDQVFMEVRPALAAVFKRITGGDVRIIHLNPKSKERFAVRVELGESGSRLLLGV